MSVAHLPRKQLPPPLSATYVLFPSAGEVRLETEILSDQPLAPMEVLVRSEATAVSTGTELSALLNTLGQTRYPIRPGYTCVGRLERVGSEVHDFAVGDRVFFAGKHASYQRFTHGQSHQWGRLYPVPADLDPLDAAMANLARIALTGPDVTELKVGDTVAVFGLGVIGNLAGQLYQQAGARVIGLDPKANRCQAARECGMETVLSVPPQDQQKALEELTGGRGVDVSVDAAGHSAVIITAVECTARFGQVILLGTPRTPWNIDISPALRRVHERGLVMRGAHEWRLPAQQCMETRHSVERNLRKCFELIGRGHLQVAPLRSHVIQPEQIPQAYRGLVSEPNTYSAVVIDWRKG